MQGVEEEEIVDRPETIVLDRRRWREGVARRQRRSESTNATAFTWRGTETTVLRCSSLPTGSGRRAETFQNSKFTVRPLVRGRKSFGLRL